MSTRPIRVYWSQGKGGKNFGDWLSPMLCEALSGRQVTYARPWRCDLFAVGSILRRLEKSRRWPGRSLLHIWGSGSMYEKERFTLNPRHIFHAVRGPRSRDRIDGVSTELPLGDPGLLSDLLLPVGWTAGKKHHIGIIPHYEDQAEPAMRTFIDSNNAYHFIDVLLSPPEVLKQIARCEIVVSTSLHGIVCADSVGTPSVWASCSGRVLGDGFKFRDYLDNFGLGDNSEPLTISSINIPSHEEIEIAAEKWSRPGIDILKANLSSSFPFSR